MSTICTRLVGALIGTAIIVSNAGAASAQGAPSARPNLEGTWARVRTMGPDNFILGLDLPYKPATQNLASDHLELFKAGRSAASAHLMCRPTGIHGMTAPKGAVLILQTPAEMAILSQEDRNVRHVYMGETHPAELPKTYSGHSVARWEKDVLVIDTVGFNGKGQLDEIGNPHSDQLHVVERWTASADGNTLTVEYSFTDPVYYTQSFTKTRTFRRAAGLRLGDYDCAEDPRSDDFANLTFEHDWFKPVCVREVRNGVAADRVTCPAPSPTTTKPQ